MHNTGNPMGSDSILDLYDNSSNIDQYVNSQEDTFPDRFGTKRLTLAGLIKRSMTLRNEINDFSGALTFKPEWSDVPMNVSEGVGGEGGALNLQAEALGNRTEINKITSREALRRSYLEVGLNLVEGSFEQGGVLVNSNDVLLQESTGKVFSGPAAAVAAGTNPTSGGFVDKSRKFQFINIKQFGAVGDGVADDTSAINNAISFAKTFPRGCTVFGVSGDRYRITSGITIDKPDVVLDLQGACIVGDFTEGWVITIGGGTGQVITHTGVRNGLITTSRNDTTLNGVRFRNGVRRRVVHDKLHITDFKGIGLLFEQLNWSIQDGFSPLIERCGTNLWIDDNGNAITIAGIGLDGATTYNARIRGAFSITFIGGYIQNAGLQGVLLEASTTGSSQYTTGVVFAGVYFERNGTNHIWGKGGRGLVVHGCYMNNHLLASSAIRLTNWIGADIRMNTPASTGAAGFVSLDTGNSLIAIGKQAVTSGADMAITGDMSGVIEVPIFSNAIPTASPVNVGAIVPVMGSGSGANRTQPYMCLQVGHGTRVFTKLQTAPRKQGATAAVTPFVPNLNSLDVFDMTVPNTGLTISAPSGPFDDGDEIKFIMKQNSDGGGAITWDPVYKTSLSNTGNAANTYASVTFTYSAGRGLWIQTSSMSWVS